MKTVDVITEIRIEKPVHEVAAYASNPDHAMNWYSNIKSVTWITQKPLQIGTRISFNAKFLGKQLAYTYEIAEFIPNERFVMRTATGPFPMETIYTWEAISDHETRMTLQNRGNPDGFSKLLAPAMELAIRIANRKDLKRLKKILEEKTDNRKINESI